MISGLFKMGVTHLVLGAVCTTGTPNWQHLKAGNEEGACQINVDSSEVGYKTLTLLTLSS